VLLARAALGDPSKCHYCGYDLTGIARENCPECGGDVRPAAVLAWERRHRRTRRLLFWSTPLVQAVSPLAAMLVGNETLAGGLTLAMLLVLSPIGTVGYFIMILRRRSLPWPEACGTLLGIVVAALWLVIVVIFVAGVVILLGL
jgi:hypothetical protein